MKIRASIACAVLFAGCAAGSVDQTTEDNIESQCSEAVDRLTECLGSVPEGFEDACAHDPSPDTLAIVDELLAAECPEDSDRADLFEDGFALLCKPGVIAAYLVTRARNGDGEPIVAEDAESLRPFFGDLVDTTVVHWDALIIDEWHIGSKTIQFPFNVLAQTFAGHIYYDDSVRPGDISQVAVLGHELAHTEQAERLGGLGGFAEEYCREFYRSDFSYENNALEIEAEEREDEVFDCLLDESRCP